MLMRKETEGERTSMESGRGQEIVRAAIAVWEIQTVLKKSGDRVLIPNVMDRMWRSVVTYENTKKI